MLALYMVLCPKQQGYTVWEPRSGCRTCLSHHPSHSLIEFVQSIAWTLLDKRSGCQGRNSSARKVPLNLKLTTAESLGTPHASGQHRDCTGGINNPDYQKKLWLWLHNWRRKDSL